MKLVVIGHYKRGVVPGQKRIRELAKHRFCISIWNKIFGDILDIYRQEDKETSLFNYK